MSTSPQKPVPLSPGKRLLGLLAFVAVVAGSITLGIFLSGGLSGSRTEEPAYTGNSSGYAMAVVFVVLAVLLIPFGVACYAIVILSNCFTSEFTRPFYKALKKKVWVSNLIAGFFLQIGASFLIGAFLAVPVSRMLSAETAFAVCFLGPLVALQLLGTWLNLLAPLDSRVIHRRLLARGIGQEQLATGRIMGVSDPSQSSLKKFTAIEGDVGVLWINQDELLFRGDEQDWAIPHQQLVEIERVADAGSTSAYFGAVHVILRFRYDDGSESRIRLHPQGFWTATGRARALNEIADRLNAWKDNPSAGRETPPVAPALTPAPAPLPPAL